MSTRKQQKPSNVKEKKSGELDLVSALNYARGERVTPHSLIDRNDDDDWTFHILSRLNSITIKCCFVIINVTGGGFK